MPGNLLVTDTPGLILVLGVASAILGAWLAAPRRRVRNLPVCHGPIRRPALLPTLSTPLTYGSASERREWFRRRGGRVKVCLAHGTTEGLRAGWVIDRSTGGLCLRVHSRLEEGTVVGVRPVHAPGRMPWVHVEVRSCRECPGGWELGCRFVSRPSWDVMLHFG